MEYSPKLCFNHADGGRRKSSEMLNVRQRSRITRMIRHEKYKPALVPRSAIGRPPSADGWQMVPIGNRRQARQRRRASLCSAVIVGHLAEISRSFDFRAEGRAHIRRGSSLWHRIAEVSTRAFSSAMARRLASERCGLSDRIDYD